MTILCITECDNKEICLADDHIGDCGVYKLDRSTGNYMYVM